MEAEPVQFLWRRYEEILEPARAVVAKFVGARPRDLVFVTNATTGVNSVMRSLKLRQGDELLTTAHDYNACRNVVAEAAKHAGAKLIVAAVPFPLRHANEALETVMRAVTPRTRLALAPGFRLPLGVGLLVSGFEFGQQSVERLGRDPGELPERVRDPLQSARLAHTEKPMTQPAIVQRL